MKTKIMIFMRTCVYALQREKKFIEADWLIIIPCHMDVGCYLFSSWASPTVCYFSFAKSCVLASCYNYLPSWKEVISNNLLYFTCQIKKKDGSPDSVVDRYLDAFPSPRPWFFPFHRMNRSPGAFPPFPSHRCKTSSRRATGTPSGPARFVGIDPNEHFVYLKNILTHIDRLETRRHINSWKEDLIEHL